MTSRVAGFARALRRAVRTHRRLLAAGLAAGAVAFSLDVVAPDPPATTTVAVAAADLEGGDRLRRADLTARDVPSELVPEGAFRDVNTLVDRVLAAPVRAGEALTDVRIVGPDLLKGYGSDLVAAPVRIADSDAVGLVRVGDVIDVLAPDPHGRRPADLIVSSAPVVALPDGDPDLGTATSGALVVLAVSPTQASALSQASVEGPLTLALRGG